MRRTIQTASRPSVNGVLDRNGNASARLVHVARAWSQGPFLNGSQDADGSPPGCIP